MEKIEQLKDFILERKVIVISIVIILFLFSSGAYFIYKALSVKEDNIVPISDQILAKKEETEEVEEIEDEKECTVVVDIKGQITSPGTYKISCEGRVQDVIEMAGGVTSNADTSVLNLGKKVFDEMVIIIYSKSETKDFITTKQEEKEKEEQCIEKEELKNDACITEDKVVSTEAIENTSTNTDIFTNDDSNGVNTTPETKLISINTATKEELVTLSGIGDSKAEKIIEYRNQNGPFKTLEELKNVKGIGDSIFDKIKDSITL